MTSADSRPISEILDELPAVGDLRLRQWRPGDATALCAAWADDEIARWNPVPGDRSLEHARSWIAGTHGQHTGSALIDMVVVDTDDAVVGELGLRIDRRRRLGEIGFWVTADRRRTGVGRRLLDLGSRFADAAALRGLVAVTHPANSGAHTLLRSCGWFEVVTRTEDRAFVDRRL